MKNESSQSRIIQVKDVNIGENIKRLRVKCGYKQTELVTKLQVEGIDISVFTYNRIERGTQNPTTSFLLALCGLLRCDMNDIFGISA